MYPTRRPFRSILPSTVTILVTLALIILATGLFGLATIARYPESNSIDTGWMIALVVIGSVLTLISFSLPDRRRRTPIEHTSTDTRRQTRHLEKRDFGRNPLHVTRRIRPSRIERRLQRQGRI